MLIRKLKLKTYFNQIGFGVFEQYLRSYIAFMVVKDENFGKKGILKRGRSFINGK